MTTISVSKARANFYQLVSEVNMNHQPVLLTNSNGKNVVLIGEEDWREIQETLHLTSIPGMVESIVEGVNTPLAECVSEKEV